MKKARNGSRRTKGQDQNWPSNFSFTFYYLRARVAREMIDRASLQFVKSYLNLKTNRSKLRRRARISLHVHKPQTQLTPRHCNLKQPKDPTVPPQPRAKPVPCSAAAATLALINRTQSLQPPPPFATLSSLSFGLSRRMAPHRPTLLSPLLQ